MAYRRWAKTSGTPNITFYESPEVLTQFDQVRMWLNTNHKKYLKDDRPSAAYLSKLVVKFIEFQEDHYGGQNFKEKRGTRLPARFFIDFREGGGLCQILARAYKFKYEEKWPSFDLEAHTREYFVRMIKMFESIKEALINSQLWIMPRVFFTPYCKENSSLLRKYERIVEIYGGLLTVNASEATHFIFPVQYPNKEIARGVFKTGNEVLLHWYYTPDSWDSWVEMDLKKIGKEPPNTNASFSTDKTWYVSANWLTDLDIYYEWMSEVDYEVDEAGRKKIHHLQITALELNDIAIRMHQDDDDEESFLTSTNLTDSLEGLNTTNAVRKISEVFGENLRPLLAESQLGDYQPMLTHLINTIGEVKKQTEINAKNIRRNNEFIIRMNTEVRTSFERFVDYVNSRFASSAELEALSEKVEKNTELLKNVPKDANLKIELSSNPYKTGVFKVQPRNAKDSFEVKIILDTKVLKTQLWMLKIELKNICQKSIELDASKSSLYLYNPRGRRQKVNLDIGATKQFFTGQIRRFDACGKYEIVFYYGEISMASLIFRLPYLHK